MAVSPTHTFARYGVAVAGDTNEANQEEVFVLPDPAAAVLGSGLVSSMNNGWRPVISAFWETEEEDQGFQAILSYLSESGARLGYRRPCLSFRTKQSRF